MTTEYAESAVGAVLSLILFLLTAIKGLHVKVVFSQMPSGVVTSQSANEAWF
jgi:hypothetical protein